MAQQNSGGQQTTRLRVTQVKSGIGRKKNQRETLRTLGLKRIHDSVVQEDRPEIRGMIATVPHLVRLEVIEQGSTDARDSS